MTEDLRNRVETILNSALEEIDISDIMSSDSRTELIVDALEEKIEENNTAEIQSTIDSITEDISAAYITPELSVSSSGIEATYDAERNALKLSGTATGTRRILCLNGQNSIATTSTDFNQTFADGKYHFEMSILSEGQTPSKSISWSYTYGKFSNGAPIFTNGNTSATLTFTDHPVMVGLYCTNGTEFGQGGESDSDYTYITFTATKLSAIDSVARAYVEESRDICAEYAEDAAESAAAAQEVLESIPADYSMLSLNVTGITGGVRFGDDRLNHLYGMINYGYDQPADFPVGSTASTALAVKRNMERITLNGSASANNFIAKVNNDVQRVSTASQIDALTNGTQFESGHTYRIISKKVSGTGTRDGAEFRIVSTLFLRSSVTVLSPPI